MEEFNIVSHKLQKLAGLREVLVQGQKYIPELSEYIEKVERMMNEDGEISVVLLGRFSDGKTSTIAGLLGRLESNMKIDNDESSDELTIYRPKDLKKGFKIVDTPGLFGTKEKEFNGKNVAFSQITERYISEAHIIIYICGAVTPLKESHAELISRIMRDYNKLDNTIFVINKMDEAGYDLLDKEDFSRGCQIKKEYIVSRLRTTINLTPEEERRLHIACIAADPKGKGLEHWFSKIENYYERSHIKDLRNCVNAVVNNCDSKALAKSTTGTAILDVVDGIEGAIEETTKPVTKAIAKIQRDFPELQEEQRQLKRELISSKSELLQAVNEIKNEAIRDINSASLETIGEVISSQIGEQNGEVTFYVLDSKLKTAIEQCSGGNSSTIQIASVKFDSKFAKQDSLIEQAVTSGISSLKGVKISGKNVKTVRNLVAKNYKFKPWGAIKLGKAITKGFVVLSVAFEGWNWYKKHKDQQKLNKLKQELVDVVNNAAAKILNTLSSDEQYFQNYAPSYLELCQKIEERNNEIKELELKVKDLEAYKKHIENWRKSAEDTAFEEV